jgi:hypothetical protein|uniref:Uncharacterized protein n=1 Tax=Myoviridae sp. ctHP32 TaxID=2823539 RepID=A0A8S5LG22_9CAUD|nr:MAG TPA: hypothetical protein [Myoviridae sp. ctHP32]
MIITLIEYARKHKKSIPAVRQMAARGGFKTAYKVGRDWVIDDMEPYPDRRIKDGKYIGFRQKVRRRSENTDE